MNMSMSRTQKDRQRFYKKISKIKLTSKTTYISLGVFLFIIFIAYMTVILIEMSHKSYVMEINIPPNDIQPADLEKLGKVLNIYVDENSRYWWNYNETPEMLPKALGEHTNISDQTDYPELKRLFLDHLNKYQNLLVIIKINRRSDSQHFVNIIDEYNLASEKYLNNIVKPIGKKIPIKYMTVDWTKDDARLIDQAQNNLQI